MCFVAEVLVDAVGEHGPGGVVAAGAQGLEGPCVAFDVGASPADRCPAASVEHVEHAVVHRGHGGRHQHPHNDHDPKTPAIAEVGVNKTTASTEPAAIQCRGFASPDQSP